MNFDQIFILFGQIVAYGGGGAVIAYLMFQYLGKQWIENRFAERLEQLRHTQAMEIQRLRVEIDSMLSGALKLQEKEFEILPEAWLLLEEAYGKVVRLVSPIQEYPDLDRLNGVQLEEFLERSDFRESEKDELRRADDKVSQYQEMIYWHNLSEVRNSIGKFHSFVESNSIFLNPELKKEFEAASNQLWSAMVKNKVGHQAKDYKMQNEGWAKVKTEIDPMRESIREHIFKRLHAHGQRKSASN